MAQTESQLASRQRQQQERRQRQRAARDGPSATAASPESYWNEEQIEEMLGEMTGRPAGWPFLPALNAAVPVAMNATSPEVFAAERAVLGQFFEGEPAEGPAEGEPPQHFWMRSPLVREMHSQAPLFRSSEPLPRWRTMRREPQPSGLLAQGDFLPPWLRAFVVGWWEYHPGWGTTMPPPVQTDPSTWRGVSPRPKPASSPPPVP